MSEQPPARKRYRSDDSSDDELSKKAKFQASASGTDLQLSIDEGIRQICAYQSDLRRGCVSSKGSILAVLDAMRAEIIGSDKHSLRLALPDEVLLDIFVYLDRLSLEKVQYACRRFRTIVDLRMTDVCYRVIDGVHIRRDHYEHTVTAWIGDREYGPLLTSDVSEHGERTVIIASKLQASSYTDHVTDVLANVCRNANVLIYKISGVALSEHWPAWPAPADLREMWQKFVPANAHRMTVSELILDGCAVETPPDGSISRETIVMRVLECFRRVHRVRLSIRLKSYGHAEDDRQDVFTDRFLEFSAAHEIGSVDLPNWDEGISEMGVVNFLLNAPSDRCKRELSFGGARGVTANFYDALVKASTECATAHAASLEVSDCDIDSLPQDIRDADEESGYMEYRFFRGLLPFTIAGDTGGCCSGTLISYERGDAVRRDEDEGRHDAPAPAQDYYADDDQEEHDANDEEQDDASDEEEHDGNHVELGDLELVDEC